MSETTNIARIEQLKQNPQLEHIHELAIQLAAQAWTDDSTKHLVMMPELAIVFAQTLDFWIRHSKQLDDNLHFYLDVIDQCAKHIGPAAYTDDTGQLHDSPMRLKIPALVQKLAAQNATKNKTKIYFNNQLLGTCEQPPVITATPENDHHNVNPQKIAIGQCDYSSKQVPPGYHCGTCGSSNVRLYRRYQAFMEDQKLFCKACALQDQKMSQPDGQHSIGWLVAAVPTPDGDTFWGYTSVPDDGVKWWDNLPTETTNP